MEKIYLDYYKFITIKKNDFFQELLTLRYFGETKWFLYGNIVKKTTTSLEPLFIRLMIHVATFLSNIAWHFPIENG